MKYKEFREIAESISKERHLNIDDIEFEVNLTPTEIKPECFVRYFGDIHELMDHQGMVYICCDGIRGNT